jgi:hypothetical protein
VGVSFGLVKSRAVVRGDSIVACPTFVLSMNFDRRVMAGAQGARFFKRIVERLERAETEMAPYLSGASPTRSESLTQARADIAALPNETPAS